MRSDFSLPNRRGQSRRASARRKLAWPPSARLAGRLCLVCAGLALPVWGQVAEKPQPELQAQVESMQARLQAAQRQIDADHAELMELRRQIEALTKAAQPPAPAAASTPVSTPDAAADLQRAVADMQERQAIQQAEIQVHEQEKVESASRYAVKLRGLVLFNASVNNGAVDQPVSPLIAVPGASVGASGSLTATGRQTLLGLDAAGPLLWGAHTYADLEMDFAGANSFDGYGSSLFRLRTASMQLAWPKTTVRAGIAPLILTPFYATSYFSIAEPTLGWSGSLWGWLPQISVEQRLDIADDQRLVLQAALADIPDAGTNASSGLGAVSAAERSRYPGIEVRAAWQRSARRPTSFGVGGYWSPHSYAASSSSPAGSFDAWAGTADWKAALPAKLQLSGSLYDGAALGGLNAGTFKDGVFAYGPTVSAGVAKLTGLRDAGGWAQLKFKPIERLEFNLAFGQDDANARQLRAADLAVANPYVGLARNRTAFGNIVFRPSSAIILSGEYRKLRSWQIVGPADGAGLFGLAAGYEF